MSAINPASFQTPLGGLQIPGSVGASRQSALSNDIEQYPNRRQQRYNPASTSAGSSVGGFDWNPGRDSGAINSLAFQQLYAQPYLGQDLDVRQVDHYPMEYGQGMHQALNMHSPFTSTTYNTPSLHHSSSFTSRPNSSNARSQPSQVLGRDMNSSFHGLSLGH